MALADERNRQLLERDLRYAWWNNHARRRRRDRHVHRVRHEGPSQGSRQLRRVLAALDLRRLLPQLPHAAREVRPDDPARPHRARVGPDHRTRATSTRSRSSSPPAGSPTTGASTRWTTRTSSGSSTSTRAGTTSTASGGSATPTTRSRTATSRSRSSPGADYEYPHRCWTCMVPCLVREDMVVDEVDGQVRTYCSETCHWTDAVAFRPEYEGRADAVDGQALRQARVGDALPRHGRRGDHAGPRLRARRRAHARSRSRTSTWTRRRCGRSTRSRASRCTART